MASSVKMWALFLLSIQCLAFCTGQRDEGAEYLGRFNYEFGLNSQDGSESSDADSSAQVGRFLLSSLIPLVLLI